MMAFARLRCYDDQMRRRAVASSVVVREVSPKLDQADGLGAKKSEGTNLKFENRAIERSMMHDERYYSIRHIGEYDIRDITHHAKLVCKLFAKDS